MANYKGGYQIIDLGDNVYDVSDSLDKKSFTFLNEYYRDKKFDFKPILLKINVAGRGKITCFPFIAQEEDMIYLCFFWRDLEYQIIIELGESLDDTDITLNKF